MLAYDKLMPAAALSSVGEGGLSIPPSSHIVKRSASANLHGLAKEYFCGLSHNVEMAREREQNHLRAWREFREMTQEELAEKVGTTGSVISMLESGSRGLSDKWLRKLAPVLQTTAGHLLDHDPNNMQTDILDIWTAIAERDKPTARRILESFKTGTKD